MAELEFQLQKPNNRQDVCPHSCNLFRPLEWYAMLPSDEARALIDPRFMELFLEFLRCFGEEIARHLDVPNDAESMLKKALGSYYDRFEPSNR